MIRTKFLSLLFSFLFITSLVSCSKEDEEVISPNVSLLTNGAWTGSAVFSGNQDVTQNLQNFNITKYTAKFDRDGTYVETYEGQPLTEGNWEYMNDERVILFDKGTDDEYSVVISKLTSNELNYLQSGFELRLTR